MSTPVEKFNNFSPLGNENNLHWDHVELFLLDSLPQNSASLILTNSSENAGILFPNIFHHANHQMQLLRDAILSSNKLRKAPLISRNTPQSGILPCLCNFHLRNFCWYWLH